MIGRELHVNDHEVMMEIIHLKGLMGLDWHHPAASRKGNALLCVITMQFTFPPAPCLKMS